MPNILSLCSLVEITKKSTLTSFVNSLAISKNIVSLLHYVKTHLKVYTDIHPISSLAASVQYTTRNQFLKKQKIQLQNTSQGFYTVTLMASKRKKSSSKAVTIVKREKAGTQVYRMGSASS